MTSPAHRDQRFDLCLVGTGFASSFFLLEYLKHAKPSARVLVLERGARRDHLWHLEHADELERESQAAIDNSTPAKPWIFKLVFGGGSNCWWACTPRMLPEDFELATRFGIGRDWPVRYDELEPYYCEVEDVMQVAGASDDTPFPRSRPYPLPAHRFNDPDRLLKKSFPDRFFALPCARPSRTTPKRPRCCASGVCNLCPIDSKFTVLNELAHLYDDPRVTLVVGANVGALERKGGAVDAARYQIDGRVELARADLFALGANAIFNAHVLLASGLEHDELGAGLVEQAPATIDVDLAGVDNYQGSTANTGHGYVLHSGDRRRTKAAALMESWNVPLLRDERGKWRRRAILKFVFEDQRQARNRVRFDPASPDRPIVEFHGHSEHARAALDAFASDVQTVLAALPVEDHRVYVPERASEAHVLGTTVMGDDPATSVVDRGLVHHELRNLLVLGGSVFPTAAPANPTLTLSALSLFAARRALGRP